MACMSLSRRSIRKDTLRARRVWNTAAHESRELSEYDAAMELLIAARIIVRLLGMFELDEPTDEEVEAGVRQSVDRDDG